MTTTAYQIIAVDFDGTLCYSNWPELGEPNRPLIEMLKNYHIAVLHNRFPHK